MPRYRLHIAYDGTDFSGWQRQTIPPAMRIAQQSTSQQQQQQPDQRAHNRHANEDNSIPTGPYLLEPLTPDADPELRTVQAVLERTIRRVVRQPVTIMGASRTDAGVHANAQCAVFDTTDNATNRAEGWPADRGPEPLRKAINARLPSDVAILAADIVPENFSPIADARAKGYAYTLCIAPERTVFQRRYAHHVREELDIEAMRQAAAELVGKHDFASFAAAGHGRASTIRTIFNCNIIEQQSTKTQHRLIRIDVSGDGFLWNMVRIIAGTLVDAGKGRIDTNRVRQALQTPDRRLAGPTLPPQGLRLEWIRYDLPMPTPQSHEGSQCQQTNTHHSTPATSLTQSNADAEPSSELPHPPRS